MFRPFMAIIRFCPYQLRFHYTNRVTGSLWATPGLQRACYTFLMYFKLHLTFTKNKSYYLITVNYEYTFTAKYINTLINSYDRISDATDETSHKPESL